KVAALLVGILSEIARLSCPIGGTQLRLGIGMLTVARAAMSRLRHSLGRVCWRSIRTGVETARIGPASRPLRLPCWLLSVCRCGLTPIRGASRRNVGFELRRIGVGLGRAWLAILIRLKFAPLLIARLLRRLLRPASAVTLLLRKTAL